MPRGDAFHHLARYYDPLMDHVDYDRWRRVCLALTRLLPKRFVHVDAACGTGTLVGLMRAEGWRSTGFDLSPAMLRAARTARGRLPLAAADLRALPFAGSAHLLTCLFDSLNFLLDPEEVRAALAQFHSALAPGGLLYLDVVTECMVTLHFDGQEWSEESGGVRSRWKSRFDRSTGITETRVHVDGSEAAIINERVYPAAHIGEWLREAGFDVLGACDAETWGAPHSLTTRVDFLAVKPPSAPARRRYARVRDLIREALQ